MSDDLDRWIAGERAVAASQLLAAVSATELVKERPGFHQSIRPSKGAILASPVIASYDPDPDYFFHWLRDGAVVADAMRLLAEEGDAGARARYDDYLAFSLKCCDLSGKALLAEHGDPGARCDDFWRQYVRPADEIAALEGDAVLAEPRYNPDATLDILKWTRPQHDGPAMRALANLRWRLPLSPESEATRRALILRDLDFTLRRWSMPSVDIWEEDSGFHFYTRLVQREALAAGADFARAHGEGARADAYANAAAALEAALPAFMSAEGFYRSRLAGPETVESKALDGAVLLAVIHAGRDSGLYSPLDPAVMAVADRLEALFAQEYPINRDRALGEGVLLGRYTGDTYYSGGPYLFTTFAHAELRYARAAALGDGHEFARGEAIMASVRRYTPASGELAEQVDKETGGPSSARRLTWSYAGFLTAERARRAALARV